MTIPSGWTIATYVAHNEALRESNDKFEHERDRRYAEVDLEREKALRIKEEADKAALLLAREIQTYKDEKANELREQINSERGLYATHGDLAAAVAKIEITIQPVLDALAVSTGRGVGISQSWSLLIGIASLILALIGIGSFVFRQQSSQPVVVLPAGTLTLPTAPQPR